MNHVKRELERRYLVIDAGQIIHVTERLDDAENFRIGWGGPASAVVVAKMLPEVLPKLRPAVR